MFTVVSRKLSKKLACRTEQNMSTKNKKIFNAKCAMCLEERVTRTRQIESYTFKMYSSYAYRNEKHVTAREAESNSKETRA